MAVALADKIDTLTGFWAIDEKPTGSKDPFALRRAALGVIRLVLGNGVRVELIPILATRISASIGAQIGAVYGKKTAVAADALMQIGRKDAAELLLSKLSKSEGADAFALIADFSADTATTKIGPDLLAFLHDRLKVYLKDQGIRHDIIDACLAMPGNDDLTLLVKRAEALAAVMKTEDGANLLQGYKRANNILTQAEAKDGVEYSYGADVKFAEGPEERALFAALDAAEAKIGPAMAAEDFAAAMTAMAALRGPLDAFFTAVQVNADKPDHPAQPVESAQPHPHHLFRRGRPFAHRRLKIRH